jgi:hypothetical protein
MWLGLSNGMRKTLRSPAPRTRAGGLAEELWSTMKRFSGPKSPA